MSRYFDRVRRPLRTIMLVLVVFALARIAFGVFAIVFMSDDGLATSLRATVILGFAALVGIALALWLRRTPNDERLRTND